MLSEILRMVTAWKWPYDFQSTTWLMRMYYARIPIQIFCRSKIQLSDLIRMLWLELHKIAREISMSRTTKPTSLIPFKVKTSMSKMCLTGLHINHLWLAVHRRWSACVLFSVFSRCNIAYTTLTTWNRNLMNSGIMIADFVVPFNHFCIWLHQAGYIKVYVRVNSAT